MSFFDNGISRYIHAVATVHVWFPVDRNGYVGSNCPLEIAEEDEEGGNDEPFI